jgi:hypothetical protein
MQSRFDSIAAAKLWDGAKIPPNQEVLILIRGIWTHCLNMLSSLRRLTLVLASGIMQGTR